MTIKDKDELDKIVEYEKMLENYGRKLKKLSNDNNYVEDIMSEEIEEFVEQHTMYRNGLKAGIEQGTREKQCEIVLNMYNENLEVETISKYTKLSIEEIKEILDLNLN